MKKTITLLLAATSVAMAKTTDVTDLLVWDENNTTASLVGVDFNNTDVTVALTLNWDNLNVYQEYQDIFTVTDESNHRIGVGMYFDYDWCNDINLIYSENGGPGYITEQGAYQYIPMSADSIVNSALVFTATTIEEEDEDENGETIVSVFYQLTGYLYLWENGVKEPYSAQLFARFEEAKNVDYLTLHLGSNSIVDQVEVYTGVTDNPLNLAEKMLGLSTPEPTTATLSLLALAGLAARRRRH